MHKTNRGSDDTGRVGFSLTHQVAQLNQSCRRITEDEQRIGMFLHGQANAGLCTGDSLLFGHCGYPLIREIAFHLHT